MGVSISKDFVARDDLKSCLKRFAVGFVWTAVQKTITGPIKLRTNRGKLHRSLEIGPGAKRLAGFETLNITGGPQVDYIGDATGGLPFPADTFDLLYASHILEHTAWYRSVDVLKEWIRVLKPGGTLEIWVPDGLKIAEAFVMAERSGSVDFHCDGWWRFNEAKDPCRWVSGRIFSYGDGTGAPGHFNWHLGLFSERYLQALMRKAGLTDIRRMNRDEVRGHDHGWINLGVCGRKPRGS